MENRSINIAVVEEVALALQELKDEINKLLNHPAFEEYISAHIHPLMLEERYPILYDRFSAIVEM